MQFSLGFGHSDNHWLVWASPKRADLHPVTHPSLLRLLSVLWHWGQMMQRNLPPQYKPLQVAQTWIFILSRLQQGRKGLAQPIQPGAGSLSSRCPRCSAASERGRGTQR